MDVLLLPFHRRFIIYTLSIVLAVLFVALAWSNPAELPYFSIPIAVFIGLSALGTADLIQTRHAVLRNYPISAHLRFLLESIRPEMRQYFFEDDKFGMPFSRDERALVYQRAKMQLDKRPFGTQYDVYADGYEWLRHSIAPRPPAPDQFRLTIGGPDCTRPYSASVFNISAMSFGALSPNAIRALNGGAKKNHFAHDTGEGGFSPYHREMGGDIIWEIGSGYFGCRKEDASFCKEKFAATAILDQIKMVELKLSQGAKPGHGGVCRPLRSASKSRRRAAFRWASIASRRQAIQPFRHRLK
jgi:glutamate synthase domain-containing protein 2